MATRVRVDGSAYVLLLVVEPRPAVDYATGVQRTEFGSSVPLFEVGVTAILEGRPESVTISVPGPGVPADGRVGSLLAATGLTFMTGSGKTGKHFEMWSASALTVKG